MPALRLAACPRKVCLPFLQKLPREEKKSEIFPRRESARSASLFHNNPKTAKEEMCPGRKKTGIMPLRTPIGNKEKRDRVSKTNGAASA